MAGRKRHDISFATGILPMARFSFGVLQRWAFETDRSQHVRHGRTATPRGSSDPSDETVSIMSLFSASGIYGMCSPLINATTMRRGRIYHLARTHQRRAKSTQSAGCFHCRSWVGYIINTFEFEFTTRTGTHPVADGTARGGKPHRAAPG